MTKIKWLGISEHILEGFEQRSKGLQPLEPLSCAVWCSVHGPGAQQRSPRLQFPSWLQCPAGVCGSSQNSTEHPSPCWGSHLSSSQAA